jgi:hypothetical protein
VDRPDTTLKNHLAITVSCSSFVSCTSGRNIRYVSTLLLALRQDRRVVVCSDDGRQTSVQWRSACGWSECWGTPVEGESRPAGRYIICLPGGGGSGVRFGLGIVSSNLGIVGRGKLHIRPEMVCYGILAM